VVAGVVWQVQRKPPLFPDWESDLPAAMGKGRAQKRPVLILFHGETINETTRKVSVELLNKPESLVLYKKYKYVRVHVPVNVPSLLAAQWTIRDVPTMVIVGPSGREVRRCQGYIGLEGYWHFLDLDKPWETTRPASGPSPP